MSTTQVFTIVGTVVGAYFGYPGLGAAVGGLIGGALEEDTETRGPRLMDRKTQVSTYGASIPYLFGTTRVAGNVIWADDIGEETTETEQGKGGPTNTAITYTYFGTFAVLLGYGPLRGVRRIWADAVLIFDGTGVGAPPPNFGIRFYQGTEDQLPDPTMEAALGVGNVPAYRGFGYIVFNRMPLEKFGNRLPSMTIELVGDGEWSSDVTTVGVSSEMRYDNAVQRLDGYVIAVGEPTAGTTRLVLLDPATGAIVTSADHAIDLDSNETLLNEGSVLYVPPTNEVWVAQGAEVGFERYSADTLAHVGTVVLHQTWNAVVGAYEPNQRRVIAHRASSQVGSTTVAIIEIGGEALSTTYYDPGTETYTTVYGSEGLFFARQVVTGGNSVFLACNGLHQFGVFSVGANFSFAGLLATQSTTSSGNLGTWDTLHQRYVVAGSASSVGTVWTVTDTDPPVITAYTPAGMFATSSPKEVQYIAGLDVIAVWTSVVGIMVLTILDAATFEVLHQDMNTGTYGLAGAFVSPDDPGRTFNLGNYQPYDVQIFGTTVGAAVGHLAVESGMEPSDIDVSELGMRLRGYIVSQSGPARAAIEQLATDFLFQGVEEDDVFRFRLLGGTTVATIPEDECSAGLDGDTGQLIATRRAQEVDLPTRLSVTAPDPLTDHQPGTQYAERRAPEAGREEGISTAVVMTATEARRLANALIFDRWASRESLKWTTARKYSRLSPTDPVVLAGRRVRIVSRTDEAGRISWEGVTDDADVVTQVTEGTQGSFPGQVLSVQVPTLMTILDTALLADAQDDPGAYVAAWGIAPYWRGAVVYSSIDAGVTWVRVATMPRPGSAVGTTTNTLGDWAGGNVFDEANSVNVSLSNGTMSSDTRAGVLAGNNPLAIEGTDGWEVLQYREATLEADGSYTLRGLLRGRRGTEFATGGHAPGNRAVLLNPSALRDLPITNSQIGVGLLFKAVSIGDTLSSTASTSVTINAERLKPWSPVDLRAERDIATGDITLTWKRRTRLATRFAGTGGINVPLGEADEAYTVKVYDDGTYTTVVRTINVTAAEADYSASDQTTDFGGPQATLYVSVGQVSTVVGLGHELQTSA